MSVTFCTMASRSSDDATSGADFAQLLGDRRLLLRRRRSSRARSVMSRAIFEAPTTSPASSRIGETVSEIENSRAVLAPPDAFRSDRRVCPARIRASTVSSSLCRSSGMIIRIDWPIGFRRGVAEHPLGGRGSTT